MDDMMATPLNKLPPPLVQQKPPGGSGGSELMSYEALRDDTMKQQHERINAPRHTPQYEDYAPPSRQLQQQQQQPSQNQYAPFQQQEYYPPPPQQQHHQQQHHVAPPPPQPQQTQPMSPPPVAQKKSAVASIFSVDFLRNRKIWILAALIFLAITYGIPKMRQLVPALISPTTGKVTYAGIGGLSALTAILFAAASEFV